jgi:ureidoacrylate peracid hydrolase
MRNDDARRPAAGKALGDGKALILVDFQNEWLDRGSDYFVGDVPGLVARVNRLIGFCRRSGFRIIFTRHVEESGDSFAAGSRNSELIAALDRRPSDPVVVKSRISPFYRTSMESELKGVQEIVACGILTNLCVRSLVEEAYDRDFRVTVIKDCCVALDEATQEFTFRDLKATREEVSFLCLEEFTSRG